MYFNKLYEESFVIQLPKEGWLHFVFALYFCFTLYNDGISAKLGKFSGLFWLQDRWHTERFRCAWNGKFPNQVTRFI